VTTDQILNDESIGTVLVATRHSSHAELAERALRSGRAVFVEKPPALTPDQLGRLRLARDSASRPLLVGFNRRYSPVWEHVDQHLGRLTPRQVVIRVNAGPLAGSHWLNDAEIGGGRLIGEGCHFVDLACWLIGAVPDGVTATAPVRPGGTRRTAGCFTVGLTFGDGSLAEIAYLDAGSPLLPKEYVEVHANGRSAVVDDFRSVTLHGANGRARQVKLHGQDKGHKAQLAAFAALVLGGEPDGVDPLATMAITLGAADFLERAESVGSG
jgi:predicted dehydrogenase